MPAPVCFEAVHGRKAQKVKFDVQDPPKRSKDGLFHVQFKTNKGKEVSFKANKSSLCQETKESEKKATITVSDSPVKSVFTPRPPTVSRQRAANEGLQARAVQFTTKDGKEVSFEDFGVSKKDAAKEKKIIKGKKEKGKKKKAKSSAAIAGDTDGWLAMLRS